jgi:peptidyl-prolyl cis-trans isomerase B (cyclophilin B)
LPVATSKSRQRALARAKAERQIARRAAAARRRRQWQAGVGGVVVLALVGLGTIWATGGFKADPIKPDDCAWTPVDAATDPNVKTVAGTPPTKGVPNNGTKFMTINTNRGTISAVLDLSRAKCTVASFTFLSQQKFFEGTVCGRLTTKGNFVLQCGDPGSSGKGGPSYRFASEYIPPANSATPSAAPSAEPSADPSAAPVGANATYTEGMLATWNDGSTGSNGSQFIIVWGQSELSPNYTVFGNVTVGMDVVKAIAAGGEDGAFDQDVSGGTPLGGGHPKLETKITTLTIADTAPATPTATPPATSTPAATPSASTKS